MLRSGSLYRMTLAALAEFIGVPPEETVPAAFTSGQWTATIGDTEIDIDITALPSNGGSAITALQYRLDGGTWTSLTGTGTGVRTITGLTNGVEYDIELRAVNAVGNGTASDVKSRTPTATPVAPSAFTSGQWTATADIGEIDLNITALPSNGGSAITALQYRLDGGTWTNLTGTGTGARTITGLTAGVEYDVELRAVNAVGNGAASDVKSRTPTAAPTVPAAFTSGDWTATAGNTQVVLNLTTLPSNGGSAITALQYRIDEGTWTNLTGTGTGSRTITGLTNATEYDFELRAVNAVGNGAASDVKSRTPVSAGGTAAWVASATTSGSTAGSGITATKPSGTGNFLVAEVAPVGDSPAFIMPAPTGWTAVGGAHTAGFGGQGTKLYVAPSDVASTTFISTTGDAGCAITLHLISGVNLSSPVRAFDTLDTDDTGEFNVEDDNMPTPSVSVTAGDLVMSFYQNCQGGSASGTPTSGYTRVRSSTSPVTVSTLQRTASATGATGLIYHGDTGGYQARVGLTLALAAA